MFSTRSPRLSCSGLMHRLGAPVFRCQGKRRVYSLHARKDAVEAFLAVISSWLEVSAPPQGRQGPPVAGQPQHWQGAPAVTGMEVAPLVTAPQTAVSDRMLSPSSGGAPSWPNPLARS